MSGLNFNYKGHTYRALEDTPQYEIKSDKTDHIAAHKGHVLSKIEYTVLNQKSGPGHGH